MTNKKKKSANIIGVLIILHGYDSVEEDKLATYHRLIDQEEVYMNNQVNLCNLELVWITIHQRPFIVLVLSKTS